MTRPRGRHRFAKIEGVLHTLSGLLENLPKPIRHWMLSNVRHKPALFYRALRYMLLRSLAANCGTLVDIRSGVYLFALENLSLGSRISIHPMCYIDATGGVRIGSDVSIAHNVSILSTEHGFSRLDLPIRDQEVTEHSVHISDDVWIGAGARILAGVNVGRGAIVAAGAVVTRDVPPGCIVGGVPAAILRNRKDDRD